MSEYKAVLDTCTFDYEEEGKCTITGWIYVGNETPVFEMRVGKARPSFELRRIERPDVIAALPEIDFPDPAPGFEIEIRNLRALMEMGDIMRLRVRTQSTALPLLQKSLDEVRDAYNFNNTMHYYLDFLEKRLDKVYIQGWCVSTFGEYQMKVTDEKGAPQKDVVMKDMRRMDLVEVFQTGPENCHGFALEIPRSSIKGDLVLKFINPICTQQKVIDMKKFDQENSRFSKTMKLLDKKNLKQNLAFIKKTGVRNFVDYLIEESSNEEEEYAYYAKRKGASALERMKQRREKFSPAPLFSIVVPLYHTPLPYLQALIDSVRAQTYQNWQLCLADGSGEDSLGKFISKKYGKDHRICYRLLKNNAGISGNTNAAIEMAKGDYIVFADHDDMIAPEALYENAKVLRDDPSVEFIYSDEDLTDADGNVKYGHFKPDFNIDFLRSINYICHLVVVKKTLVDEVGVLDPAFDGSQDYDFVLRCVEKAKKVHHIPKALYHWRSHSGSTAGNEDSKNYAVDAGLRALENHYRRLGLEAEVEYTGITIVYRTKFKVLGDPLVSILIPNKDHIEDLYKCIESIEEKSTYRHFEIIVIENNSEEQETFDAYEKLKERYDNVSVVYYEGGFNFSAINNFGAQYAKGDYYLLLNNDTEVITPDWLDQMVGYCQREDVGIVGAKLFYPDDTVQHAGVVIGIGGVAGHIEVGRNKQYTGNMRRLYATQDISAVTGACLMVKKSVFDEVGGLDESFAVAFNDVDFCLRVRAIDKLVVLINDVQLYHFESKSRGYETTPEKAARFNREVAHFQERYRELLEAGDPYYNPNLSLNRGDCSLAKVYESVKGYTK